MGVKGNPIKFLNSISSRNPFMGSADIVYSGDSGQVYLEDKVDVRINAETSDLRIEILSNIPDTRLYRGFNSKYQDMVINEDEGTLAITGIESTIRDESGFDIWLFPHSKK